MPKILHLITGVEAGGGAEKMLLATLPQLKSAEQAVCVLRGKGENGARLEAAGIKVFYLQAKDFFDFDVIKRYRQVIRDFQPDLQVNYLIHADIFGRWFGKPAGVKKIISYIRNRHTNWLFKLLDRLTLHRVDYLLTNSAAVLDYYRQRYHFPENRSAFIPNGIDREKIKPAPEEAEKVKAEFGFTDEDFVILSVARLHKQKDLPTLLHALAIIKEKGFCCPRLLLCGQGEEQESLQLLVDHLGLYDNVRFLGLRQDVGALLNLADVFVLPSLHEGMSNALLEAMAAGKPCVVSAIPENAELIKNKENGLTFIPGNETDLAEKIMALAASPAGARKFGEQAALTAAGYDLNKIISRLDEFFSARLNDKKKIIWIANDRNKIYLNFFNALGEAHAELDLFLIAGEREALSGRETNYRWQVFRFAGRGLINLFFLPWRLIAGMTGRKFDQINLDFYRGLNALLKKENPDLVMVNLYGQPTSWQALWYCLIHRKPFVLCEEKKHLGHSRAKKIFSALQLAVAAPLFLAAKKIYCYTADGLAFGKKYFPVLDKEKIDLLPAAVDTRIFYNEHLVKDSGKLKILVVARLVPFKRHEDILRAMKIIQGRGLFDFVLNLRASVDGDDPLERDIELLIDQLEIRPLVNFLPPLPYERQRELYNQNDLLVLASYEEPIGMVVPEAMACGLPVVVSDTCGAKTYVQDRVNGYIFKTFDFFDLAEKIILLADRKRREEFGAAAEKTIQEKFDERLVAQDFFAKIKNLL